MKTLALLTALSALAGCGATLPAVPGEPTDTFFSEAGADQKVGRSMKDSAQRCRERLTELRSSAAVGFGVLREEIVGARLASVGNGRWANPLLESALAKTIASGAPFRDLQIDVPVRTESRRFVRVGGSRIRGVANETVLVLLSIEAA